jgi:hypothetical protein
MQAAVAQIAAVARFPAMPAPRRRPGARASPGPFARRRTRSFQNVNLAAIMNVIGELGEIAHIEPPRTDRALFEVIGLGLSDAVAIGTGVPRKFAAHDHSSSRSRM